MWTVPGAEAEKVFGWAELIGGYVIQLSKVGGVVASLPHCRSSADTMYTRGHVEWSRQQLRGGGGSGVAELSQTLHRDPAPALAQPFSRKFM